MRLRALVGQSFSMSATACGATDTIFSSISSSADAGEKILYLLQARRTGKDPSQSFVKVDLLLIDNDSEKEEIASKCKLVQIP